MYKFLDSFKPNDGTKWQKIIKDFHDDFGKLQRCYLTVDSEDVYINIIIIISIILT